MLTEESLWAKPQKALLRSMSRRGKLVKPIVYFKKVKEGFEQEVAENFAPSM